MNSVSPLPVWPAPLLQIITALGADTTRLVGGTVRAHLANAYTPTLDHDLATTHTPNVVTQKLEAIGAKVIPTGQKSARHGTVTIVLHNFTCEITTLRADTATDGRHATVKFTDSWKTDAHRRDFTINAIYMDLDGTTYDFVNGLEDFQNQRLRFVGNPIERVQEDSLRILRYLRFAAHLGWEANLNDTLTMLQPFFSLQKNLSQERLWKELKNLLLGQKISQILPYMQKYQPLADVNFHFVENSPLEQLLHAYPAATAVQRLYYTAKIPPHFCFSKAEWQEMKDIKAAASKLKRYTPLQTAVLTSQSATAAALAINGAGKTEIDTLLAQEIPSFPLQGKDVLNQGIAPSPQVGLMLKQVQTWWLRHNFPPKEDCLKQLESLQDAPN